jgi:hypothetical protein
VELAAASKGGGVPSYWPFETRPQTPSARRARAIPRSSTAGKSTAGHSATPEEVVTSARRRCLPKESSRKSRKIRQSSAAVFDRTGCRGPLFIPRRKLPELRLPQAAAPPRSVAQSFDPFLFIWFCFVTQKRSFCWSFEQPRPGVWNTLTS